MRVECLEMSINKLVNTDIALGPCYINNMRTEYFEIVRRLLIDELSSD